MIGNIAAAERIPKFSNEEKGTLLKDWLNDLWIKRDNYNWTDEQVARLILECCKGRAGAALAAIPPQNRVCYGERAALSRRRILQLCQADC